MKTYFLRGEKISLRALTAEDIESDYRSWLNDSEVCNGTNHHRRPFTKEQALQLTQETGGSSATLFLGIECNEKSSLIGTIAVEQIDLISKVGELFILIGDKDYWGKGVGYESSMLVINHAFNELNLNRIHCGTEETNIGMQRLADKIGMIKEGVRRQHVFKSGEYRDVFLYSILKEEFKQLSND